MSRRRAIGVLATAVASGLLLLVPATASASPVVVEVGWWTRVPTTSAPEGGINVGSAPDGPNSVAAIRIDLGAGVSSLTVTATEAGGVPETASVQVCPATDAWTPAEGGALEEAPDIRCMASATFVRGDDGTWSADVTSLVTGKSGTVSLGLVAAGPDGESPLGVAPSEVEFERPTVVGTEVPPPTTTTTTSTTTTVASPPPTGSAASSSATVPPPTTSPPTTDPTTDSTVLEIVRPTTTTTIPIAEERALAAITDAGVASGEGRPIREAVFLVVIATAIGLAVAGASKYLDLRG